MLAFTIFAIISTAIALTFTALAYVERHFEKKLEAEQKAREAFAKQVKAWCENPYDPSLRWW